MLPYSAPVDAVIIWGAGRGAFIKGNRFFFLRRPQEMYLLPHWLKVSLPPTPAPLTAGEHVWEMVSAHQWSTLAPFLELRVGRASPAMTPAPRRLKDPSGKRKGSKSVATKFSSPLHRLPSLLFTTLSRLLIKGMNFRFLFIFVDLLWIFSDLPWLTWGTMMLRQISKPL